MTTLFVRHEVSDYSAWRQGYDANGAVRDNGQVRANAVYRSVDKPNEITVTHDFDSLEAAQAFAGSAELKAAMAALGVVGQPDLWFTEKD